MKCDYYILHFSDLHFGKHSLERDAKYMTSFADFFHFFLKKIKQIIKEKLVRLVIISGDLTSVGNQDELQNQYLKELVELFSRNNIPILTCNGNHDLRRDQIETGNQFNFYTEYILSNKDILRCILSKDFIKNQASYVFLKEYNSIFISINSCVNIEKEKIGITNEGKDLLNSNKLDVGIFSAKELDLFLEELRAKFGNRLDSMNKFLVCHHPLRKFEESVWALKCLKERNLVIVFSGHGHNYAIQVNENISNFVAGSPSVSYNQRTDTISLIEYLKQFNLYFIDMCNGKIKSSQIIELDGNWQVNKEDQLDFEAKYFLSLNDWCEKNEISNLKFNKLKELKINLVFERKSAYIGPPIEFIISEDEKIEAFIIEKYDTQGKVDLIREWIYNKLESVKEGKIRLKIIDKTDGNRFISQLPDEYRI